MWGDFQIRQRPIATPTRHDPIVVAGRVKIRHAAMQLCVSGLLCNAPFRGRLKTEERVGNPTEGVRSTPEFGPLSPSLAPTLLALSRLPASNTDLPNRLAASERNSPNSAPHESSMAQFRALGANVRRDVRMAPAGYKRPP